MKYSPQNSVWKWVIMYALIAVVLVAVVSLFSLNFNKNTDNQNQVQNNSETADWEMYRNDEYGFEVKYPTNSLLETYTNIIPETFTVHIQGGERYLFSIHIIEKNKHYLDYLFSDYAESDVVVKRDVISGSDGNWNAIKKTDKLNSVSSLVYYNTYGNHIYAFQGTDDSNLMSLFDKVFSTFKFTK